MGSLYYLTFTKLDILFGDVISHHMEVPIMTHMKTRMIIHYIKGTIDYGFCYSPSNNNLKFVRYNNSDWDGRKFKLNANG